MSTQFNLVLIDVTELVHKYPELRQTIITRATDIRLADTPDGRFVMEEKHKCGMPPACRPRQDGIPCVGAAIAVMIQFCNAVVFSPCLSDTGCSTFLVFDRS